MKSLHLTPRLSCQELLYQINQLRSQFNHERTDLIDNLTKTQKERDATLRNVQRLEQESADVFAGLQDALGSQRSLADDRRRAMHKYQDQLAASEDRAAETAVAYQQRLLEAERALEDQDETLRQHRVAVSEHGALVEEPFGAAPSS